MIQRGTSTHGDESMDPVDRNAWAFESKHVLTELIRLNTEIDKMRKMNQDLLIQISMLQVKASIFGAVGGTFVGLLPFLVQLLKK